MAITITLGDDLAAGLANKAKKQRLTVEQLAIGILTEAVEESESDTLQEIVAKIRATPPNQSLIRPATGNLGDRLIASPDDHCFDLETWEHRWSVVATELKAITQADDVAEGRGA